MNNKRRERLKAIIKTLDSVINALELIKDEEEDYMSNIPENLQGGERYSMAEDACNCLEEAIESIEEAIESIEEARM